MKQITVALLFTFLLANSVQAQRGRRLGVPHTIDGGVSLLDSSDPLNAARLRLESEPAPPPVEAAGKPIPVSQLRIPSKAVKEFDCSQKAFQSGDVNTSAEHLQKALQIYPDFLRAHNALGLRYIQLGQYQKALSEHELALSLDPRNLQTHENISFVLLLLERAQEAETEARQALELNSQSIVGRYTLGRALIAQRRVTPEALEMLRQSENAFPDCSLVLAQIHFLAGRTDQVIAELRQYLRASVDADNKQKAGCWVAQLSQQPLPAGCPAGITQPSFH
jgi:tetratricopeptide (TPR) repeat protein